MNNTNLQKKINNVKLMVLTTIMNNIINLQKGKNKTSVKFITSVISANNTKFQWWIRTTYEQHQLAKRFNNVKLMTPTMIENNKTNL
jgi:hypothetical protein